MIIAALRPDAPRRRTLDQRIEDDLYARFERETAGLCMRVVRDAGVDRHLRFWVPRSFYWFDIVTWPGALVIDGDCGTYAFRRITDMFKFFESAQGEINPDYWAQKLTAPDQRAVRRYSKEALADRLHEWWRDQAEDLYEEEAADLLRAIDDQILNREEAEWDRQHAAELLDRFEHNGRGFVDTWEWSIDQWEWQFIWCCWAIVTGIARYRFAESYR